ncbi:hypothetical protein F4777DRAFT_580701 [Nemania sp. FL0916]|nr:hypothetical protein F4777DRAFT_580701 [Nemania sp. FL0916]
MQEQNKQHQQDGHPVGPATGKLKEPAVATWSSPSAPHSVSPRKSSRRPNLSESTFTKPQTIENGPQVSQSNNPILAKDGPRNDHSSNTWTSSSDNPEIPLEEDGNDDREQFISEYNRLAQRNAIRPFVPGDFTSPEGRDNTSTRSRQNSWISKMLRQASEQSEQATGSDKPSLRHQRGLGDVALDLVHSHKRDGLKNRDVKALIRLSDTPGIFRVPGSIRVINALYDYYCTPGDTADTTNISHTTRCPTLPAHIRCNAHDIASTFKRFLAGLPGGILGSLPLFDALVAIHSQLQADAESHWTKQSKLRARLIALAIGTVGSQYQRELICAVFGLLCLVGRAAENAPREDDCGRPLPTGELMGYNALGIVFGPLLIGDWIDGYSMKVADPAAGLVLLPLPRSRKGGRGHRRGHRHRHRHRDRDGHAEGKESGGESAAFSMDKIHVANSITEMLILHWREVVRQIRNTGSVRTRRSVSNLLSARGVRNEISSSTSGDISLQDPSRLDDARTGDASHPALSSTSAPRTGSPASEDKQSNVLRESVHHQRQSGVVGPRPIQRKPVKIPPYSSFMNPISNPIHQAYHIPPDRRPSQVRESISIESISTSKMLRNEPTKDDRTRLSDTNRLPRTRKTDSPSSPSSSQRSLFAKELTIRAVPRSDTRVTSSGRERGLSTAEGTSSSIISSNPLLLRPNTLVPETDSQHEYDAGSLSSRSKFGGGCLLKMRENSNDTEAEEAGSVHTIIDEHAGSSKKHSPSLPPRGEYPTVHGHKSLQTSTTDSDAYEKNPSLSTIPPHQNFILRPAQQEKTTSNHYAPSKFSTRTPSDQWRSLIASSKASTDSLAKLAKERRLKRRGSDHHISSTRSSKEEAAIITDTRPDDGSQWGWQLVREEKDEVKSTSTKTNTFNKKLVLPETPTHLSRPDFKTRAIPSSSPMKRDYFTLPTSLERGGQRQAQQQQRSASKPMPGAMRAMAALFDSAAKKTESPPLSGRSHRDGFGVGVMESGGKFAGGSGYRRRGGGDAGTGSPMKARDMTRDQTRDKFTTSTTTAAAGVSGDQGGGASGQPQLPLPGNRAAHAPCPYPHLRQSKNRGGGGPGDEGEEEVETPPHRDRDYDYAYDYSRAPTTEISSKSTRIARIPPSRRPPPVPGVKIGEEEEIGREAGIGGEIGEEAETTPVVKSFRSALRPVVANNTFSSARTEPHNSPDTTEQRPAPQPPRLGTMTPHPEEPAVGHFVRPSSTSPFPDPDPDSNQPNTASIQPYRHISGNSNISLLHAQIRGLRRLLDARDADIARLRSRLETQEQMDVGTLCEQLRIAKREAMNWRRRAETAEKRLGVFQRFGERVGGLDEDRIRPKGGEEGGVGVGGDGFDEALRDDSGGGNIGDDADAGHGNNDRNGKGKGRVEGPRGGTRGGASFPAKNAAYLEKILLDASESGSLHTEPQEAFRDRVRRGMAVKMRGPGGC